MAHHEVVGNLVLFLALAFEPFTERPPAVLGGIAVHLEPALPVLERVLRADRLMRELARLAREHEARAELERDRRAEQEAARLGGNHAVDAKRARVVGEQAHGLPQRVGVGEQRRDVLEPDPWPRKVRNLPDQASQSLLAAHVPGRGEPLRSLTCDPDDLVEVAVVVQQREAVEFRRRRDEQIDGAG